MYLTDFFMEPIAYVVGLRQAPEKWERSAQQVRTDLIEMLRQSEVVARREQLCPEAYSLARFAVCAFIDEALLDSSWKDKELWLKEQLQRHFYNTSDAGEEFFIRLGALGPEQREVREVFCLCLALGFSGRYCGDGDQESLQQIKTAQLKLMATGSSALPPCLEQIELFPQAHVPHSPRPVKRKRLHTLAALPGVVAVVAPVLLLLALFAVFRFTLSSIGQNFLRSIPY